jgi:hypothetical protein
MVSFSNRRKVGILTGAVEDVCLTDSSIMNLKMIDDHD